MGDGGIHFGAVVGVDIAGEEEAEVGVAVVDEGAEGADGIGLVFAGAEFSDDEEPALDEGEGL